MNTDTAPAEAQPKSCVDQRLERLMRERQEITLHIEWLTANRKALEAIGLAPARYWDQINFYNPSREQVLGIIKSFPGTWNKSLGDDGTTMNYELPRKEGQPVVRINNGALPPCCRLVEEWVDLPAQPATRVLRKVVKCPEPLPKIEPELEASHV